MGLKKTRKILSIVVAVVIAFSSACLLSSLTLEFTLANSNFFSNHLITSGIVEECNNQLNVKYEALEAESGIPSRVFKMAMQTYSTEDNLKLASANIFTEETAELYSNERIEYFYNLCTEYLNGNEIKFNKSDVKRTAQKAALIYSETVGIHNTDAIAQYLDSFKRDCSKASSIAIVSIIICIALLVIIYKKKNDAISYFASGIAGGGFGAMVGALLALIFKVGSKISISPAIYQSSILSMIRIYFAWLILSGVLLLACGSLINFLIYKYLKREEDRQATRFNKIIAKL